jgi:hypothetical protein
MRADPIGGMPYESCDDNPNEICTPPVSRQLTPIRKPPVDHYVLAVATDAPVPAGTLDRQLIALDFRGGRAQVLQRIARAAAESGGATRWSAHAILHQPSPRWAVHALQVAR